VENSTNFIKELSLTVELKH